MTGRHRQRWAAQRNTGGSGGMSQWTFPGNELRQRREELGLSAEEVFRKTRIALEYIDALERGDAAALPAPCYVVGFLKTYCGLLGLNADRYVDSFRMGARGYRNVFVRQSQRSAQGRRLREAATWAVISAMVALGWATYMVVVRPNATGRVEADRVEMTVPPAPSRPAL